MFGFFKRKKEKEAYVPAFTEAQVTAEEPVPGEPEEEEPVTLEDGRVFPAAFVREIRSYTAEELKFILDEQGALYDPAEYAYIREVFHERLGDL